LIYTCSFSATSTHDTIIGEDGKKGQIGLENDENLPFATFVSIDEDASVSDPSIIFIIILGLFNRMSALL
jgi:hypothetical protein